jgi:putative membrane protein
VGIPVTALPTVNAVLNGTCALLLAAGFVLVRRRRIAAHRVCMQAAFAVSILFLVSYLVYHVQVGSVPFPGQGWVRPVYFAILISHTVLAALVPPLALTTLVLGLRASYPRHRRIARWTLPIWLYVSVTGVVVYWMLYRLVVQ